MKPMSVWSGLRSQWLGNRAIQRWLVCGMYACVAWAIGRLMLTAGSLPHQAVAVALASVVTFVVGILVGGRGASRPYRRHGEFGPKDWVLLLVPIVLVLRLLPYLALGGEQLATDVAMWRADPTTFVDINLVWSAVLLLGVWGYALAVARHLERLSMQPGEAPPQTGTVAFHEWLDTPYQYIDHAAAWRSLMGRFLVGGLLLLFIAGVAEIGPDLLEPDRPVQVGTQPALLLYFLLGLLLAAQTGLDRLRSGWLRGGAGVQVGMARRWLLCGLALVVAGLWLALLLPTNFTQELIDQLPVLGRLLWPLYVAFQLLLRVLSWLISHLIALLLAPLAWLLPQAEGLPGTADYTQRPAPPPMPDAPSAPGGGGSPLLQLLWQLIIFAIPAVITLYALWNAWQKREALWELLSSGWHDMITAVREALVLLVAWVWRSAAFVVPSLRRRTPPALARRAPSRKQRQRRGFSELSRRALARLSPRQLLLYFYLSILAHATSVGWGRHQSHTAYEASDALATRLPTQRRALARLTEAFVRVRYGRVAVTAADAGSLRPLWDQVRAAFPRGRRFRFSRLWKRRANA